jgi:hypothetical protein
MQEIIPSELLANAKEQAEKALQEKDFDIFRYRSGWVDCLNFLLKQSTQQGNAGELLPRSAIEQLTVSSRTGKGACNS